MAAANQLIERKATDGLVVIAQHEQLAASVGAKECKHTPFEGDRTFIPTKESIWATPKNYYQRPLRHRRWAAAPCVSVRVLRANFANCGQHTASAPAGLLMHWTKPMQKRDC